MLWCISCALVGLSSLWLHIWCCPPNSISIDIFKKLRRESSLHPWTTTDLDCARCFVIICNMSSQASCAIPVVWPLLLIKLESRSNSTIVLGTALQWLLLKLLIKAFQCLQDCQLSASATWQKIWGSGKVLNIWKKNLTPDLLIWNFWKFWFQKIFRNSELFRSSEFKSEFFRSSDLWSDYFQMFRFFIKLLMWKFDRRLSTFCDSQRFIFGMTDSSLDV